MENSKTNNMQSGFMLSLASQGTMMTNSPRRNLLSPWNAWRPTSCRKVRIGYTKFYVLINIKFLMLRARNYVACGCCASQ